MNTAERDEMEIDLRELFSVLKSKLWLMILIGLVVAAGAGVATKTLITPMYESTSKLYVVSKSADLTSLTLSDLQLGTQLTKDYMVLIKSRKVTEKVIENLGLNMSHEQLLGCMSISNPTDTRILEITVTYSDAYIAKQIVDEIASVASQQISEIMDMAEPNVVEDGVVSLNPVSPSLTKNVMIGGLLGVFLVAGIVCVMYLLDDTVKSTEDVQKYLAVTTIGVIPMEENKGRHAKKNKKRR
ncbi:MAG: polysaccharide export protein [Lachnospiraceae bacterium]|nr:polysaccharide export protein [Lachnospiraceae bacterium]